MWKVWTGQTAEQVITAITEAFGEEWDDGIELTARSSSGAEVHVRLSEDRPRFGRTRYSVQLVAAEGTFG